jgi:hypothetical protein
MKMPACDAGHVAGWKMETLALIYKAQYSANIIVKPIITG